MIDNPKKFVMFVVIVVVVLTVAIAALKLIPSNTNPADTTTSSNTTTKSGNTGKSTTPSSSTSGSSKSVTGSGMPAAYDAVIAYTDKGFSPQTLEVKAGTSVRFINKSSESMRIAVVSTPGQPVYSEFAQGKSVGRDGVFDINLDKAGIWIYENLNNKVKTGIITVK